MHKLKLQGLRALYEPKLVTVLRHGYGASELRRDLMAGLTVAIVALPLAMALAIASGTSPEKGLHTAIVAGFLISVFGGSRVQIGGPTAAFIPVVFGIVEKFGFGGLILCTLLAGFLLIAAGLLRLGRFMKFIPQPVITGFTAGIAVSILGSQVKDFFGLHMNTVPAEFFARWAAYAQHWQTFSTSAMGLAVMCIAVIVGLRRWQPKWPGFLLVVIAASIAAAYAGLAVDTIGTRFGNLPSGLPQFALPVIPFERTFELLPSACTIAFLAGVESLLSAVVADGMMGGHHRSNGELVAQGIANIGSALCGGLPATGALARTAVNIRSGGRSPVAGMAHAAFLLVFMLLLAPLMAYVPLPALAAVLLIVAWQMSDIESFRYLLKGPLGDRLVLLVTFGLTVTCDLTVAIEVGMVLSAFVFMHRMSDVAQFKNSGVSDDDEGDIDLRAPLPPQVATFRMDGPLFFAVTGHLDEMLDLLPRTPEVFILQLDQVPMIDASGARCLQNFLDRCRHHGTHVILCGLRTQPRRVLAQMHVTDGGRPLSVAKTFLDATKMAEKSPNRV